MKKNPNMTGIIPHILTWDGCTTVNADGSLCIQPRFKAPKSSFIEGKIYIRHYMTKSLSEFCEQKLGRTDVIEPIRRIKESYYWAVNNHTPEKIEYLRSRIFIDYNRAIPDERRT